MNAYLHNGNWCIDLWIYFITASSSAELPMMLNVLYWLLSLLIGPEENGGQIGQMVGNIFKSNFIGESHYISLKQGFIWWVVSIVLAITWTNVRQKYLMLNVVTRP